MLTIGILHGCRQNKTIFEQLMVKYVKKLKAMNVEAKWIFIEGQYDYISETGETKGKMWYSELLNIETIGIENIFTDSIIATMTFIDNIVTQNKVDILLGFSQGGNVVSTYLKSVRNEQIKCAIIMAGYDFPIYRSITSTVPVLYITSEYDEIVPPKHTLIGYDNLTTMYHDKGHKVCQASDFCSVVMKWLYSEMKKID